MTTLNIKVDHEKKTLVAEGRIAVGEDVAVTLDMGAEVEDLDQLRLRLRHLGSDVAAFPISDGDSWSEAEIGAGDGVYTCVLNLETEELRALFVDAPERASLMLDVVVDQVSDEDTTDDYQTLYGRGRVKVYNWVPDLTVTDIHEGRKPKTLFSELEKKMDRPAAPTAGNLAVFVNSGTNDAPVWNVTDGNVAVSNDTLASSSTTVPTSAAVKTVTDALSTSLSSAVTTLTSAVNSKVATTALEELAAEVDTKADAADLDAHTNDDDIHVTTEDKAQWNAAEPNVQSDWEQDDSSEADFIKNKPTIDTEFDSDSDNAIANSRVALFHAEYHTNKTATNAALQGKADLDENGKVLVSQLPSYVSDVLEYSSASAFPETGEANKIYVAKDTNKTYRWGGTAYVEISQSLALGETSSTAYAGNKGKANADAITAIKDGTSIDSFGDVETALVGKVSKSNTAGLLKNDGTVDTTQYLSTAPVTSVNGKTGAVVLDGDDIPITEDSDVPISYVIADLQISLRGKADAADLRYALDASPRSPDQTTGEVELADRTVNWVHHSSGGVKLIFPDAVTGRARDFFVRMDSESTDTGNISLTFETGINIETADGNLPDIPEGKVTILYFTEIMDDTFLFKAETVERV